MSEKLVARIPKLGISEGAVLASEVSQMNPLSL